jgi:hypothetical protein
MSQRSYSSDASPKKVADMPGGRMGCQAVVVQVPRPHNENHRHSALRNCVLVVGGENCDDSGTRQLKTVAAYDLDLDTWCEAEAVPEMNMARTGMAMCLGSGRVGVLRPVGERI